MTSPTVLAPALLVAVALSDVGPLGWSAVGWGLIAALFAGVLPLGFVLAGARLGKWTSHHVEERTARTVPLVFAMLSVAAGVVILSLEHGPRALIALIIAMFCGLLVVLLINLAWKVSIHSAVAGGSAVILGLVFGTVGAVVGAGVCVCAAGSRIVLKKHTVAQVVVGVVVGAAVAGVVFPPLR